MPSRAPTYFHWSMDKPCTTNQSYGYLQRGEVTSSFPAKKTGPFDYTRPFTNCGFFPQIQWKDRVPTAVKPRSPMKGSSAFPPPSYVNPGPKYINRGYQAGYTPVTQKIVRSEMPVGVQLKRSTSAPAAYRAAASKADDIYLWHTLSGCLVHAKNYPGPQTTTNGHA